MASRHEILCINKLDRPNPHERILSIGGKNADGGRWKLSQAQAIHGIESGTYAFFVRKNFQEVNVVVSISRFGHKYIRTTSDGEDQNNLLSLPECP